jgi:acetyltransferase-like isoleucine patch superfamily enzyme
LPVEINDKGRNNHAELSPWFDQHGKLSISFSGDNNRIHIPDPPLNCLGARFELGRGCTVTIGRNVGLTNTFVFCARNAHLTIGEHTTMQNRARFIMHEPSRITIGRDCMFASDVQLMTSDVHSILDAATGKRINLPKNIELGDHVWLGLQTVVLKGGRFTRR